MWFNKRKQLTVEQVLEIRSSHIPYVFGATKLARKYGVHLDTIKLILARRTWGDI